MKDVVEGLFALEVTLRRAANNYAESKSPEASARLRIAAINYATQARLIQCHAGHDATLEGPEIKEPA